MFAIDIPQRTLSIQWGTATAAERYVIEAGSAPGGTDLTTFSVAAPANTATWRDVPVRSEIYFRVKAENSRGASAPGPENRAEMPDMKDVIEALFLGTGPYGEFPSSSGMSGWRSGSRVTVRVPHEVSGTQFDVLSRAVDDLNAAMGAVSLSIERATLTRAQWDQSRPAGITFLAGQGTCGRSCTLNGPAPVYTSSLVLMESLSENPSTWAHELGHAVGLRHFLFQVHFGQPINVNQVFGPLAPTMGAIVIFGGQNPGGVAPGGQPNRGFSELELEAVRQVYGAGLRAGSSVADFVARGLVNP